MRPDVDLTKRPVVHLGQIPLIGQSRVSAGLPARVREIAVAHKMHRGRRVPAVASVGILPKLVFEGRVVPRLRDFRDLEVAGVKARELESALAVVAVLRSVVAGHVVVEDSHAYIVHGHLADLALLELQLDFARSGFCPVAVRVRCHALDDAGARSAPLVAHVHLHAVVSQFWHFQKSPQAQPIGLHHAVLAQLDAESRQAARESVLPHDGVALDRGIAIHLSCAKRQLEGSRVVLVFPQEFTSQAVEEIAEFLPHAGVAIEFFCARGVYGLVRRCGRVRTVGRLGPAGLRSIVSAAAAVDFSTAAAAIAAAPFSPQYINIYHSPVCCFGLFFFFGSSRRPRSRLAFFSSPSSVL